MDEILFLDVETFSTVDIKKAGTVKYADSAELLLAGFQLCGNYEVYDYSMEDCTIPPFVIEHIRNGGMCAAHNALFDFCILSRYIPELKIEQMVDTQAIVASYGLPMSLDKAGKALGIDEDKAKSTKGKALIRKFCMPRKPTKNDPSTRAYPKDHQEDWNIFKGEYLRNDITAMIEIYRLLDPLTAKEQQVWVDTQVINLAGIPVDLETTNLINSKLEKLVDDESTKFIRLTGIFPTQRAKVLEWCINNGCDLPNLQAATVAEAIASVSTPDIVKEALAIRANTSHMSFKKFPVIDAASRLVSEDGKTGVVSGTLQYHASRTGRWGGRLLQPQNLTRGNIDGEEAVSRVQAGEFTVELVKACVRPMIYHPDTFTTVDYSSIEARVLQWVAGDEAALQVFRDGMDSYKWMASKIYDVPYDEVTGAQRFCGKQSILGLGYQMSAKTFIEMIEGYGETMSRKDADLAVSIYRKTHHKAVALWAGMQEGAAMALRRRGKIYVNKRVTFEYIRDTLYMNLPSGRSIRYYKPKLENSFGKDTISYMGVNDKSQYVRIKTYGGKLTENAVQGIARDILAEAVTDLLTDYRVVTHIHDEVVLVGHHDLDIVSTRMCKLPHWAERLPLDAEGFHSTRYKKG